MAAALKLLFMGRQRNILPRRIALTLSGVYAAGGQALDFTTLTNPKGIDAGKQFSRAPEDVVVENIPIGYNAAVVKDAAPSLTNYKIKIFDEATGVELANGAYPAALAAADAVVIEATFKTGV